MITWMSVFALGLVTAQQANKAKVKELLELTGSAKIGVQIMNNMIPSFQKSYSNVPEQFWKDFLKEINIEEIEELIIPVYEKYYTDEDINNLIAFYKTPTGVKVIQTMPQVLQESMSIGNKWGAQLAELVMKRLKEKGYK